jgi:hypothetical protein
VHRTHGYETAFNTTSTVEKATLFRLSLEEAGDDDDDDDGDNTDDFDEYELAGMARGTEGSMIM